MRSPWLFAVVLAAATGGCESTRLISRTADSAAVDADDSSSTADQPGSTMQTTSLSRPQMDVPDTLRQATNGTDGGGPASAMSSASIADHLAAAEHALTAQQFAQAQQSLEAVLRQQPFNPRAHHLLAVIADLDGRFAEAEQHYQTALRFDRSNAAIVGDLGYSYLLQGRLALAEQYLQQSKALNPSHANAARNLALLYSRRGDYENARRALADVLSPAETEQTLAQLFPGNPTAPTAPLPETWPIPAEPGQFSPQPGRFTSPPSGGDPGAPSTTAAAVSASVPSMPTPPPVSIQPQSQRPDAAQYGHPTAAPGSHPAGATGYGTSVGMVPSSTPGAGPGTVFGVAGGSAPPSGTSGSPTSWPAAVASQAPLAQPRAPQPPEAQRRWPPTTWPPETSHPSGASMNSGAAAAPSTPPQAGTTAAAYPGVPAVQQGGTATSRIATSSNLNGQSVPVSWPASGAQPSNGMLPDLRSTAPQAYTGASGVPYARAADSAGRQPRSPAQAPNQPVMTHPLLAPATPRYATGPQPADTMPPAGSYAPGHVEPHGALPPSGSTAWPASRPAEVESAAVVPNAPQAAANANPIGSNAGVLPPPYRPVSPNGGIVTGHSTTIAPAQPQAALPTILPRN